jgi:predicted transcriptional regulator
MMERLRAKGHLTRRSVGGVFRYQSAIPAGDAVRHALADFVERTLAGSVSPMVEYLVEREQLDDAEIAELERLLERLAAQRRESGR